MSERKCTKCKLPMKNHPGPAGDNCTNATSPEEEGAVGGISPEKVDTPRAGDTNRTDDVRMPGTLLQELTRQMGQMNVSMSAMHQTQQLLIDKLSLVVQSAPQIPQRIVDEDTARGTPPHISDKTMSSLVSGEYINIYELLPSDITPSSEMVAIQNNDGTMSFQPKKVKKSVDNFDTWLCAWSIFEAILVAKRPGLYERLSKYRQFIHICDRKYQWCAVAIYDKRYRAKLAETKSFAYDNIDNMLFVSILDAAAVKTDAKHCFRCKSLFHLISDCPFPASEKMGKDPQASPLSKRFTGNTRGRGVQYRVPDRFMHEGREICNNWQINNCKYPNCNRAHVCKGCRGSMPHSRCTMCAQSNLPA